MLQLYILCFDVGLSGFATLFTVVNFIIIYKYVNKDYFFIKTKFMTDIKMVYDGTATIGLFEKRNVLWL